MQLEKVTYEGSFWNQRGRGGRRIDLQAAAVWSGRPLRIPALYRCGQGAVVDLCIACGREALRRFLARWADSEAQGTADRAAQLQMEYEQPLEMSLQAVLTVNGKTLRQEHGSSVCYIPTDLLPPALLPETDNDGEPTERRPDEAELLVRHYGLDPTLPWAIHRICFRWATKRPPQLGRVTLQLRPHARYCPAVRFTAEAAGAQIPFVHPLYGTAHALTVVEHAAQTVSPQCFCNPQKEYPTHFRVLTATLSPDLPEGFALYDTEDGDRPRAIAPRDPMLPLAQDAAAVGIIGGADGPTALLLQGEAGRYTACSSLTFAPRSRVHWLGAVPITKAEPITVPLLQKSERNIHRKDGTP